ncbi:glycoside hydrolase family 3 protein [Anaerotignum sp. MB30-C6]|uniref:glycoside hydrolase family 3 protein n=1 Tax=Anaerotignum sp. MB30-C6 TaxID=3070814 RepID=UPI0027DC4CA8|nr:glycoside hydrolase family 3 protein [Anaerotignum sp. MB30-C6]WMI80703.1 glycoside hydrolase family 3 protein [Anaerotignum sp. MB30-C6]
MKRWLVAVLTAVMCFGAGCTNNGEEQPQVEVVKTAEEIRQDTIQETIDSMGVEEKLGQLLMADFRNNADGSGMTALRKDVAEKIESYHLGGVILFAENLDTLEQTQRLTSDFQKVAEIPLFIGIDEEGGLVSRLNKSNIPHEDMPSPGQMKEPNEAEAAGRSIGETLASMGVNVDFAPIADVNTNPENPVIGIRSYSDNPQKAGEMACAFIKGLQGAGVSGAVKHFPGHGDTTTDSHYGEVFVTHDMERLKTVEFVPFAKAIEEGVDLVMIGHIKTPNATSDDLPATLSGQSIGLLRDELNYDGVTVTDAMNMQAITQHYGAGESAVMSVLAGIDIVLMPADLDEAYQALLDATKEGRISEGRLDESLHRILGLKYDKGLLK